MKDGKSADKTGKKEKIEARSLLKPLDWVLAGVFAVVAAILYFTSVAGYSFPGEGAHLQALWRGLDVSSFTPYPLMRCFAALFSFGNALAPLCGALAAGAIYLLTAAILAFGFRGEDHAGAKYVRKVVTVGGVVAALVFITTPCVRNAFTHLEPKGFDVAWSLLVAAMMLPAAGSKRAVRPLAAAAGAVAGLGFADTPLFALLFPLFISEVFIISKSAGRKPWIPAGLFAVCFFVAFLAFALPQHGDFWKYSENHYAMLTGFVGQKNWFAVFLLGALPFAVAAAAIPRSFKPVGGSFTLWAFQTVLSILAVLAVASPLSPSSVMEPYGVLPTAAAAMAAMLSAFATAFWLLKILMPEELLRRDEGVERKKDFPHRAFRATGFAVGGVLAVAWGVSAILSSISFDAESGAFADRIADMVIDRLGGREWFVTHGAIDDHLRLRAAARGKTLHLVCLHRDSDEEYVAHLSEVVKKSGIGGTGGADLVYSLRLGILPFVQDWLSSDKDVASKVAIWGAPDLWRGREGLEAVPEFLFFGADPARGGVLAADSWKKAAEFLPAPPKWGSYRLWKEKNPITRMRLGLRRHIGFVVNNLGIAFEDAGRKDEAFDSYELVLGQIDADNVCALFNEIEMMGAGYERALAKKGTLTRRFEEIKADPDRRYRLLPMHNFYGYIRNPAIFISNGLAWARLGRPGEALVQIRRAIDYIPSENRNTLMNMMASLYAEENDRVKSRSTYESVLARDASNHDALIGMMRIELQNGENDKAASYLERAIKESGDDPRVRIETAMLHIVKGENAAARQLLREAAEADASDIRVWSLLAAATLQQIETTRDADERASLLKELEENIVATMEKQSKSKNDYRLQTTKAFLLLHKGEEHRKAARDAFARLANERPDQNVNADILLGLDISLNDVADAEKQAREVLRRNRRSPLANYVIGSIALQRGDYAEAESFLRRSVAAGGDKPLGLALNDYAETLRRRGALKDAEVQARKAVATVPELYVVWETLGSVILDAGGSLEEAEKCIVKACELSKDKNGRETDVRMLISLARVHIAKGDTAKAKSVSRRVRAKYSTLSEYERNEFEEMMKGVK